MRANATGQVTGIGNVKKVRVFLFASIPSADMIPRSDCCRERGIEVHQRYVNRKYTTFIYILPYVIRNLASRKYFPRFQYF
jgi:hypothetical protein